MYDAEIRLIEGVIAKIAEGEKMKKLVVYYSISGNTRAVAERVATSLRADLFEIRTVKTYPDDHDVLIGLAKKEVESGYIPQIEPFEFNFDKYETVIIGTPVWWYSYAPAVKSFMAGKKWEGKKVYTFATYDGRVGHTPSDFKKALRGAEVPPTLGIKFDDNTQVTPDSDIKLWLREIRTPQK